ncbi:MAG: histidine phosphatase family protein [Roseiflexaceae bacterium]|nr:histidine phosphatase family protein [Roseiflexaceae bacterium]
MLEELYLIRHAAPDRFSGVPYQIHPGPPLTEAGRREAAALAEWLEGRGLEHLFCSPFERTTQTAAAIVDRLGLEITFVEALREGAPGEQIAQIMPRIADLLTQVEDSPLKRVGFVTHGACIQATLLHTTMHKIDLSGHRYDYGNCAPTAGVWHGTRFDHLWRWELIWRPAQEAKGCLGTFL